MTGLTEGLQSRKATITIGIRLLRLTDTGFTQQTEKARPSSQILGSVGTASLRMDAPAMKLEAICST